MTLSKSQPPKSQAFSPSRSWSALMIDRRAVIVDGRFRHITQPAPDVPTGALVFNAPRPLYGAVCWKGDFVCGRHYALVPADDPSRSWCIQENVMLAGALLRFITEEQAQEELREHYRKTPQLAKLLKHYADKPDHWAENWHASWWTHCAWDRVQVELKG